MTLTESQSTSVKMFWDLTGYSIKWDPLYLRRYRNLLLRSIHGVLILTKICNNYSIH